MKSWPSPLLAEIGVAADHEPDDAASASAESPEGATESAGFSGLVDIGNGPTSR